MGNKSKVIISLGVRSDLMGKLLLCLDRPSSLASYENIETEEVMFSLSFSDAGSDSYISIIEKKIDDLIFENPINFTGTFKPVNWHQMIRVYESRYEFGACKNHRLRYEFTESIFCAELIGCLGLELESREEVVNILRNELIDFRPKETPLKIYSDNVTSIASSIYGYLCDSSKSNRQKYVSDISVFLEAHNT